MTQDSNSKAPPRSWQEKFAAAFRGTKLGIRGHSSFFVHFFFAALVVACSFALSLHGWEWCVLILCIGGVIVSELFNSAIETLVRSLPPEQRPNFWPALDIAAGAVLVASGFAVLLGFLILAPKFVTFLFGR